MSLRAGISRWLSVWPLGLCLALTAPWATAEAEVRLRSSGVGAVVVQPDPSERFVKSVSVPVCRVESVRLAPVPCPESVDRILFDVNYGLPVYEGRIRVTARQYRADGRLQWSDTAVRRVRRGDLFGSLAGPGEVEDGDWFEVTFTFLRPRLRTFDVGDRVAFGASADRDWR